MPELPTGTVTFLFTDIEGSTQLWEQYPEAMGTALSRHDALLREGIEAHGGCVFKTVGDAFCAAFSTPTDALSAALTIQRALNTMIWGEVGTLRVRTALHTGAAELREGDYFGPTVNRVARLRDAGHGGQILLSQSACDLAVDHLPEGVELRDMGEHRLRNLSRSERVFQLLAAGLPAEFPSLHTGGVHPNNLPASMTLLIGREQEIEAVTALLQREAGGRLVTLTGPGGTGKTRLGLRVAEELLEVFEDGVFFVALAPINDHGLVVSMIAQKLGVQEVAGRPLLERLKEFLQEKRLLLLLDNFEQVVAAAPVVAELLAAAQWLKVLVTSRAALRISGELEFPVPPLGLPAELSPAPGVASLLSPARGGVPKSAAESVLPSPPGGEISADRLSELAGYDAVCLFVERARGVRPAFTLTPENAAAVVEICRRLDGLPLAIELAAARLKLFSPQALLTRLERRLPLLVGGARDLPARQQTLRDAIGWSYELLTEEEKRLFRRLSVFVGGCTLEAAEAVCDAEGGLGIEVLDGVTSLVDKSLLQQGEVAGEPRFMMLETIREYGLECLMVSGEEEAIRRRHGQFFLALAEEAEPRLASAERETWLNRLEVEHDNLRCALAWSRAVRESGTRADGEAGETGLRLAGALMWFWYLRGHLSEGRGWLERALSSIVGLARTTAHAKALYAAGRLAWRHGDLDAARLRLEESVRIWEALGDKRGLAYSLNYLGMAHVDSALARPFHQRSLVLFREIGDPWGLAMSLYCSGEWYDPDTSRSFYEESLVLFRQMGDRWGAALPLTSLAEAACDQGNDETARALWEECLGIFRQVGDRWRIAQVLNNLGWVARRQGDPGRAAALYEESLALYRELGIKERIADLLHSLGQVAQHRGQSRQAAALLAESLAVRREGGSKWEIAECMEAIGKVASAQEYPERVARLFAAASALREAMDTPLSPVEQEEYERSLAAVRAVMGEITFAAAWAEGRAMTLAEAVAYALEEERDFRGAASTANHDR
jgi:predicted ATPase/class 3 adenylate cyclase